MKPIFILSLPRSGSTLLQRMLSAHSMVSSAAEPWLLLPLAGVAGEGDFRQFSHYSSRLAVTAIREMIAELPGGKAQYHEGLRVFSESVYQSLCSPSDRYFVDKTPRYYLITDFIFEVFPDAKVIFLFRHPLDVLGSIVTTFSRNRFAIHHAHVDLVEGPLRLHEAHARYSGRALTVHYEALVSDPSGIAGQLLEFLDLPFEQQVVSGHREVSFHGSMGDSTGDAKYSRIDNRSIGRWRHILSSATRRRFARSYVRSLGPDVLRTFGTSLDEVVRELDTLPFSMRGAVGDAFWWIASWVARRGSLNVLLHQHRLKAGQVHKLD